MSSLSSSPGRIDLKRSAIRAAFFGIVAVVLGFAMAGSASAAVGGTLTPVAAQDYLNRQVNAGPSTSKTFTVTSTGTTAGTDDLVIEDIALTGVDADQFQILQTASARCTVGKVLTPTAKTCTIAVVFNPTSVGVKSVGVQVATNGPTLTNTGAISGVGRNLEVSPSALEFGALVAGGTSSPKTVTITNRAADPYTPGAITLNSGSTTNYEIVSTTCSTSTPLAQDESCQVVVRFLATTTAATPNSSVGQKTSALAIASYGPNPISLVGETGAPAFRLDQNNLYLGVNKPGAGRGTVETVTLTSTGNLPINVEDVSVEGPDADQFLIIERDCGDSPLAGGESCEVKVAHSATRAGWQTAKLVFRTDASVPRNRVALTARGAGESTDIAPTGSLALGDRPLIRFQGDGRDAVSGVASGKCDLDGNGASELAMGATTWSRNPNTNDWEGAVYVQPGGRDIGGADLADRSGSAILIPGEVLLPGQTAGNQTGSVACADVNGDGTDDLLIGAWAYQYDGRGFGTADARGAAYVVFGSEDFFTGDPIDLGNLGSRGFQIFGDKANEQTVTEREAYDHIGYAMANLGDLNGDGRDEIGVLANTADTVVDGAVTRSNNGIVYVIPGQSTSENVDVAKPGSTLMEVHGASPGSAVAPFGQFSGLDGVGDVNADGVADLAVGAYTAVTFGRSTASGAISVVSGQARGKVDLADSDSYLFAAGGAYPGNRFGISVAAAGDVNGDGIDDVVAGGYPTSAANTGGAYVIYGSATPRAGADTNGLLDTAALADRGYRVLAQASDRAGNSVDGVGDINGDGLDDIVVGAEGTTANGAGKAWVVYGVEDPSTLPASNDGESGLVPVNPADSTGYIATAGLTKAQGSGMSGLTVGERFGRSVAGVGDLTGDGSMAVAVGSDQAYRLGRSTAGEVTVALFDGKVIPAPDPDPDPEPEPEPEPEPTPKASIISIKGPVKVALGKARGVARVKLTCAKGNGVCRGPLDLVIAGRKAPRKQVALGAGKTKQIQVKLTKAHTKLLRKRFAAGGKPTAKVTVTSTRSGTTSVKRSLKTRVLRGR